MRKSTSGTQQVILVGPLSFPITGRSVATTGMARIFKAQDFSTHFFDISPQNPNRKYIQIFVRKIIAFVRAANHIRSLAKQNFTTLYLVMDAGKGLYLDFSFTLLIHRYIDAIIFHHHARDYIDHFDWRVALISRITRLRACHVVQCQKLAVSLSDQYQILRCIPISNAFHIPYQKQGHKFSNIKQHKFITMGFISHLMVEKGPIVAIEVFKSLQKMGVRTKLIIAGESKDEEVLNSIKYVQHSYPHLVEYRGAVYSAKKDQFFNEIDVLLFPTQYQTETEGIVTLEALSYGVPVIAYGLACIPENLVMGAGVVVGPNEDFVARATSIILSWMENPTQLLEASRNAINRFDQIKEQSQSNLEKLLAFMEGGRKA